MQALHESVKKFERSGVSGEMGENITTIVKLLLVVCANIDDINNLPSKAKLNVLKGFC